MTIDDLLQRRVVFFAGKGGVGKTTLAAAAALRSAHAGVRTLLVSTDPAHSTGDIFETPLDDAPREITPRLTAVELDPAAEADRYIAEVKRRVGDTTPPRLRGEVERQIDIARVTPGAEEAALFDRFARILERDGHEYERLVFDTAPLGHTLRLLSFPEQMQAWMAALIRRRQKVNVLGRIWRATAGASAGDRDGRDDVVEALEARHARFVGARATLTDPQTTAFVFVMVPERLPILETERAVALLAKHGIPVGAVVVNKVLPSDAEGAFLARRRDREQTYLLRIAKVFAAHAVYRAPLLPEDVVGTDALQRLGALLRPV